MKRNHPIFEKSGRFLLIVGAFFLTFWLAGTKTASAQNVTTVVLPNGGECLTVGQSYTITFSWSGPDVEHVALYYRTDGAQPTHLDSSVIKHPINVPQQGTSWNWTPASADISETGRVWIDGHGNGHISLSTWDNSNANFSVRSSCAAPAPAVTTGGSSLLLIPPSAQSLAVSEITTSSVVISWRTDQYSYYTFSYGESSGNYSQEIKTGPPMADSWNHKVTLTNLAENTTYYFKIETGVFRPVSQKSPEYSFKTLDITPPAPVTNVFGIAGSNTALISWLNPADLDFKETAIVSRTDRFAESKNDGEVVYAGNDLYYSDYADSGLVNNTSYYYSIFTADVNGNVSQPARITLVPLADLPVVPAPPKVASTTISTASTIISLTTSTTIRVSSLRSRAEENTATLTWLNPKDPNFLGVQIVRSSSSLPVHPYDGEVVWRGRTGSFVDSGLLPEQRYNYGLFPFDWKNNFYSPAFISEATEPSKEVVRNLKSQIEEAKRLIEELVLALNLKETTKILKLGSSGEEVKKLQEFLVKYPDLYPEGLVTGYFGPLTKRAVRRFQEKYNIVSSGDEATTGFGSVEPKTRAKLELLSGGAINEEVYDVLVLSDGFSPKIITVPLGATVRWPNKSNGASWAASDPHPTHTLYPGFDAKRGFQTGEAFSFVFTKVGRWEYHDHLDPVKTGFIIVK